MDLALLGQVAWSVGIDFVAVCIGAVSGALFALTRKLDIVGTVAMALLTGYGGGIMRDILLHDQGFFFMQQPVLVVVCAAMAAVIFGLGHRARMNRALNVADTVSMAMFALAGASKAWDAGVDPVYVVILGTITAVGGGALASIAVGEAPAIFKASSPYAIAGFNGTLVFALLMIAGAPYAAACAACLGVAVFTRLAGLKLGWSTKPPSEGPASQG